MQNKGVEKYLTFEMLEDVMSLPYAERERYIERAGVLRIGPLTEYAFHDYDNAEDVLGIRSSSPGVHSFLQALRTSSIAKAPVTSLLTARPVEFYRGLQSLEDADDNRWFAFCKRVEDAARKAGLHQQFAKALAGTVEEMAANTWEHSERAETGIVGYRSQGEFEYVVADAGIGVLASLRQNPNYDWLVDSGQALETAVEDGKSRYGSQGGRGTGFHRHLHNIASRNSYLRFRSGDHSHIIDGTRKHPLKRTQPCA